MVQILYFAGLREVVGKSEETLPCEQWTVGEFKSWLMEIYPVLVHQPFYVAINEEYAREDDQIISGDTIALIPPVSGG